MLRHPGPDPALSPALGAFSNAWPRLAGFLFAFLLSAGVAGAQVTAGRSQVAEYVSPLDDSRQAYGVYLPAAAAASPAGYPVVLNTHGYGWSVSAGFGDWQRQWAEAHGWLLINLNARGPQFYDGVGDVESLNVVRDAHRRFGLDLDRVYVVGGSMGGTGAYRLVMRHPDVFAAVVGVDGWTDFREWHYHWYARTDAQNDIEEFRRPLLEAASPLYSSGRGRWAGIQASVSGKDNVVLPDNGLSLYNALLAASNDLPGAYDTRLFLDYEAGHGGSYRGDQAYAFFATRRRAAAPPSFRCESTVLVNGALYWGSLDRFVVQGARGALEAEARGETVTAVTENLDAFTLYLLASPSGDQDKVTVYADGFPCYAGAPRTVSFVADRGPGGVLWGWRPLGDAEAPTEPAPGLRKTRDLEGPIGEAFKVPFVVVYATAGTAAANARHRREAEAFARGWNDFMVHAPALQALPEESLAPADLQGKSLIVFGSEESSRLLREANARRALPVHVGEDRVTVVDPDNGDREYLGSQYGALACLPNPLSDNRTYLVICSGQWATRPDGTARQGLEYDLEKLPWAYSDYVVFNTDQSQLPFVLNVNNKPPVTCYEAGYFVEAGYFDQDWQPARGVTLDRVVRTNVNTRRARVAALTYSLPGAPPAVVARVVDQSARPVAQARVTFRIDDAPPVVRTAVSDGDGYARLPVAPQQWQQRPPARVLNLEATGAVYDFRSDDVASTSDEGLGLRVRPGEVTETNAAKLTVEVSAVGAWRRTVRLEGFVPSGVLDPPRAAVLAGPDGLAAYTFVWRAGEQPRGDCRLRFEARCEDPRPLRLSRDVTVRFPVWPDSPLRLVEVKGADVTLGSPYQVTARLANHTDNPATAQVVCSLVGDRRYPSAQTVTVPPQAEATVTWPPAADEAPLPRGLHPFRVVVLGQRGLTATADFTVK